METFSEEHSNSLLSKEWLVQVDTASSTPYLFKFHANLKDLLCCIMVTDTKSVWGEVLTFKRICRRFKELNPKYIDVFDSQDFDEVGRNTFSLITSVHRGGNILDASFEVVELKDADFAFELDFDSFKWRWDCFSLGPKTSSEILSKHLIFPLISVTYLSFYSADPVGELAKSDLQDIVDKIGRSARRAVDIHVKHTLSKPRVATTIQRMSALFNFDSSSPPIESESEKLEIGKLLQYFTPLDSVEPFQAKDDSYESQKTYAPFSTHTAVSSKDSSTPSTVSQHFQKHHPHVSSQAPESETEQESDHENAHATLAPRSDGRNIVSSPSPDIDQPENFSNATEHSGITKDARSSDNGNVESDKISPLQPAKKKFRINQINTSESDEESENRGQSSHTSGGSSARAPIGKLRGVRQPIKRGGKRF